MSDIGVVIRLQSLVGDDLGLAHVPQPVELGDIVCTHGAEYRVVDLIVSPPRSPIAALCKVGPIRLHVAARCISIWETFAIRRFSVIHANRYPGNGFS